MPAPEASDATAPRKNLLGSILHTLATVIAGSGANIVAGIVTARAFGPAGKGIINYAGVFVPFAYAAADGLRNAIAFQIGNEKQDARRVWNAALRIMFAITPFGTIAFALAYLHDPTQYAFLAVAIAFPFAFYVQTVNVLYLVRDAIERINVQNAWTIGAGSSLATVFAILVFHIDVRGVLAIWLAGFLAAAIWGAWGARGLLASAPQAQGEPRPLGREQAAFSLKGGLSAAVTLLAVRADVVIVGSTLSKTDLGLYATGLALAELPYTLSRSITWATTARISTAARSEAVDLTARTVRVLLWLQTAAAVVLAIGAPFAITLFYGHRFDGATPLLFALLPRMIFYSADGVIAFFINVRQGRPGVQFAFEAATFALCVAATYGGLWRFGLTGAAAGASVSFVFAFWAKLAYFVRASETPWRDVLLPRRADLPERARALFRL